MEVLTTSNWRVSLFIFLAIEVCEVGVLERFLRCDSFLWILLKTSPDQVDQLRVFLNPVLFEIWDSFSYLRQIQVFNLLWFISNRHFIKDDAIGPHVHSW